MISVSNVLEKVLLLLIVFFWIAVNGLYLQSKSWNTWSIIISAAHSDNNNNRSKIEA